MYRKRYIRTGESFLHFPSMLSGEQKQRGMNLGEMGGASSKPINKIFWHSSQLVPVGNEWWKSQTMKWLAFCSADNGKKRKWVKSRIGRSPRSPYTPVNYVPLTLSCQDLHQPLTLLTFPSVHLVTLQCFMFIKIGDSSCSSLTELNLHLAFIKMRVRIIETKWKSQTAGGYEKFKWHFSFYLTILIKETYINLKHTNFKCKGHD